MAYLENLTPTADYGILQHFLALCDKNNHEMKQIMMARKETDCEI